MRLPVLRDATTPLEATALQAVIRQSLNVLVEPGGVVELRIPDSGRGTVSGYYNDLDVLAEDAAQWSGSAPAIYVTLNPVDPRLLARSVNRLTTYAKFTTRDADVLRRHRWLIDFDPVHPQGISSTKREHACAIARAREARAWLVNEGWPPPILADSGNGAHLLPRIDLPNDEASNALLRRCLEALAVQFNDDTVVVDPSTYNAARLCKLYGTLVCKGDHTPDRPHRYARLLEVPTWSQ